MKYVEKMSYEINELKKQIESYQNEISLLKYISENKINHDKHKSYTKDQRNELLRLINHYNKQGISKLKLFEILGLNSTTYYNWSKGNIKDSRTKSILRITPNEKQAIINMKKYNPEYGVSRISGELRHLNIYVSPTTVYNYLKLENLIIPLRNRPNPNKEPKYLAFKPLQIISLDWSYIRINGIRYNILCIIDCFSKYLLGFTILKTVKSIDVQNLIASVCIDQKIELNSNIMITFDQGSQNKAIKTLEFLKDIKLEFKFSEVARPTQNVYIERWFKTIKNELIYPLGPDGFINEESALKVIGDYVDNYNNIRPHMTIYNFTPNEAHYVYKNMSWMLSIYKEHVINARKVRLEYWSS